MTKNLAKLLIANLAREMTPEQKETQRRSFAYGNTKIENDAITREMIDKAANELTTANSDTTRKAPAR